MPFLLGFLTFGKGIVSWLSRRSLAEIACLILCITCGVLFASNRIEKRHTAKVEAQVVKLTAELQKLSTAKNDQKVITREKIKIVLQKQADADARAKKIEQAPPAPNCHTKPEVMNADV